MEGQIDHKALTLFNNICRQDNSSTEKQLAYRQLLLKGESSHSWFVQIRKILCRYDLPNPFELLDHPPSKICWKSTIELSINKYWKNRIVTSYELYSSLKFMNENEYSPGRIRVVSPVGRFAGSFRPESFRPRFRGGSIRPYYVSRFARRSFRPWVVSPIVFIEGHTYS